MSASHSQLQSLLSAVQALLDSHQTLKQANVLKDATQHAKIILSGELNKAVTVRGIKVTKGAREAIVAAGGKVED